MTRGVEEACQDHQSLALPGRGDHPGRLQRRGESTGGGTAASGPQVFYPRLSYGQAGRDAVLHRLAIWPGLQGCGRLELDFFPLPNLSRRASAATTPTRFGDVGESGARGA